MTAKHTAAPWRVDTTGYGYLIMARVSPELTARVATVHGMRPDDAHLIATAPALLELAHIYASECGECAGTRVKPDDEPCDECEFVWLVIDAAEGR